MAPRSLTLRVVEPWGHRRRGKIPGSEDPLEKETAIHSSVLALRSPWTEEPGGLQPMGLQTVRHNQACLGAHIWSWGEWSWLESYPYTSIKPVEAGRPDGIDWSMQSQRERGPRRKRTEQSLDGMHVLHWEEWEHCKQISFHFSLRVTSPSMDKHLGLFLLNATFSYYLSRETWEVSSWRLAAVT